ncbi:MAG: SDR family NAD(P)-dependent oxidoreductase [Myxococcales bacterium]|nr:SDR family NAD(P)-dependent oxidoreductase [Myxococcales bacterium]
MSKGIVFITGASSGIGEALATELASRGYDLGLMARRVDKLEEIAARLRTTYGVRVAVAALDVADDERVYGVVDALRDELGGLDVMVANAGITAINRTGAGKIDKDKRVIAVNLVGAIATLDAAAKHFRAEKKGRLVGISSIAAFHPIPGSGTYAATKAALSMWLRAARLELRKHGIGVTAVHCGFVKSELVPNMEKYPFVIEASDAARAIADAIEEERDEVVVPAWPWKAILAASKFVPEKLMPKMF